MSRVVGSDAAMSLSELLLVCPRVDEAGAARPSLGKVVIGVSAQVDREGVEAEDKVDLSNEER